MFCRVQQFLYPAINNVFDENTKHRDSKYMNNRIEQNHRGIKRIVKSMMGFKAFHRAEATIAGIELHRMLRKGQHQQATNMSIFEQFYALAG